MVVTDNRNGHERWHVFQDFETVFCRNHHSVQGKQTSAKTSNYITLGWKWTHDEDDQVPRPKLEEPFDLREGQTNLWKGFRSSEMFRGRSTKQKCVYCAMTRFMI
jgi:hypothetical protein